MVTVLLDTIQGKLEYRINNNYLGVAIIDDKLKDKNLVAACYLNGHKTSVELIQNYPKWTIQNINYTSDQQEKIQKNQKMAKLKKAF